jgi:hypothetical protein
MHSLAETFRWQVEYRDHRQVPAVRLATTDAEVQIRLHRQGGEEVLCLGAAHEWVTVTDSIQVELPPHTLPEAGVYAIQAQITLPATLTSGPEQTVVVLPEQPELVRFEDSLFGA